MPIEANDFNLKKLFEKFGNVEECTLVLDKVTGKSKGFGFVKMTNEASVKKAIESINGQTINKVKIKVKLASTN